MVIPRWRSSGALSIWSNATSRLAGSSGTSLAKTRVMAAVRVVLPWSTWPMVPTFRCGLVRSNLPLDIAILPFCYLGRYALRHLGVMIELHGECRAALGLGAHGRRVTEHLGERHHGADNLSAAAGVHTLNVAAPGREVAHHVAHELFGHHHLDVHNGLEKDRVGPLEGLFDGHGTSDLERHLGRVDLVIRTVDQLDPDIDHGVASNDAGIQRILDALIHARDVLPRDDSAHDLVVELVACLVVVLGVDDRVAVLAPATGLPHEPALDALHALADGLAVSDLRTADVRVDPELAQEPVDDDLEVQLAHAGDDGLSCLLVAANGERRILFGEPLERNGELLLVGLCLGLDSLPDDGLGEDHLLEHDLLLVVRRDERVARPRIGDA